MDQNACEAVSTSLIPLLAVHGLPHDAPQPPHALVNIFGHPGHCQDSDRIVVISDYIRAETGSTLPTHTVITISTDSRGELLQGVVQSVPRCHTIVALKKLHIQRDKICHPHFLQEQR
jgi:hypothetical protein